MKITVKSHGLTSLNSLNEKTFDVKRIETFNFASGSKKYYVVDFEGKEYEIAEDLCDITSCKIKPMENVINRYEIQNGDIVTTNHPDFNKAIVIFDGYRCKNIVNIQNDKKETCYFYLAELTSIKRPIK